MTVPPIRRNPKPNLARERRVPWGCLMSSCLLLGSTYRQRSPKLQGTACTRAGELSRAVRIVDAFGPDDRALARYRKSGVAARRSHFSVCSLPTNR